MNNDKQAMIEKMARMLAELTQEQQAKAAMYLGAYIAGLKDASR